MNYKDYLKLEIATPYFRAYWEEQPNKNKDCIEIFDKITRVIRQKLCYCPSFKERDGYGLCSDHEIYQCLLKEAKAIQEQAMERSQKKNFFLRKISAGRTQAIQSAYLLALYSLQPAPTIELPQEVLHHHVFKNLTMRDLARFARTNRQGRDLVQKNHLQKAQALGYIENKEENATQFLKRCLVSIGKNAAVALLINNALKQSSDWSGNTPVDKAENLLVKIERLSKADCLRIVAQKELYEKKDGMPALLHFFLQKVSLYAKLETDEKSWMFPILIHAVKSGASRAALFAIERSVEVDGIDDEGNTALHLAVEHYCVQAMLRSGKKELRIIQAILQRQSQEGVLQSNKAGKTALHIACECDDVHLVALLVEKGAALNPIDNKGNTPLAIAYTYRSHQVASYLAQMGARSSLRPYSLVV